MRLPNAFVVPRPKRWTDQRPDMAPVIAGNRVLHVLARVAGHMADTNDRFTERLAQIVTERAARRRRP